ncbi:imidazole glycerol phosphate synthase subunit HisH [Sciscionella marina]|uniref:imidazole glycerol phosphate synthase subunit HisH n=1 Tax=Sciscionella marina TaxID=508770 RepID=UPI0003783B8B|nr:imidazole glycerol phosphate synthase subunit HisH [Sciscionella marina]
MDTIAILDYGSGNLRSAQRALERVGAQVELTADPRVAIEAAGLVVPGVGAFAACMAGIDAADGQRIIAARLDRERPVLGICVGMQVLFERGIEHGVQARGCGRWPGTVRALEADVIPHMGWNTVDPAADSVLFAGLDARTRFYFVHSFAACEWTGSADALLTRSVHGEPFLAAVEDGPLSATQFHPEKSGDAGATLLGNWLKSIRS